MEGIKTELAMSDTSAADQATADSVQRESPVQVKDESRRDSRTGDRLVPSYQNRNPSPRRDDRRGTSSGPHTDVNSVPTGPGRQESGYRRDPDRRVQDRYGDQRGRRDNDTDNNRLDRPQDMGSGRG